MRRRAQFALLLALLLAALAPAGAAAQTAAAVAGEPRPTEIDLSRIFKLVPDLVLRLVEKGHGELFRVIENIELLDVETEIDRYVGQPRELNDSTAYKLGLLPFHIRYPIYRDLVDQMTRLDNVRSLRIHMVTPGSVRLTDLRLRPVLTLDAFNGEGVGGEVQRSLLTHFSAREIADMTVFLMAQQPFFPQTDPEWQQVKHRIARSSVPLALAGLGVGVLFDAGAFSYSTTVARTASGLGVRWYGGFRGLGVHMRPYLRSGFTLETGGLQLAAGLADQIRPLPTEPDTAVELAMREGWLSQLIHPLGWDAFFEVALRRALQDPTGFRGKHTAARGGLFFKRDHIPGFPDLVLRGSAEAESNLETRPHLVGALGLEKGSSGIATVVQVSRVPAVEGVSPEDDRLTAFVAGTMEPFSASFTEDMYAMARSVEIAWESLNAVEERRAVWEQRLVARRTVRRTPQETENDLAAVARIVIERDDRLAELATALANYLERRRRAYGIRGWKGSPDGLHGPLPARVLVAVRERVLDRLAALAKEIEGAGARLEPLRARIDRLAEDIAVVEAREPGAPLLEAWRQSLAGLERDFAVETQAVRRQLDAYEHFRTEARRIAAAGGQGSGDGAGAGAQPIGRAADPLNPTVRRRIAWLSLFDQR